MSLSVHNAAHRNGQQRFCRYALILPHNNWKLTLVVRLECFRLLIGCHCLLWVYWLAVCDVTNLCTIGESYNLATYIQAVQEQICLTSRTTCNLPGVWGCRLLHKVKLSKWSWKKRAEGPRQKLPLSWSDRPLEGSQGFLLRTCVYTWGKSKPWELTLFKSVVHIQQSEMIPIDVCKPHLGLVCLLLGFSWTYKYLRNWERDHGMVCTDHRDSRSSPLLKLGVINLWRVWKLGVYKFRQYMQSVVFQVMSIFSGHRIPVICSYTYMIRTATVRVTECNPECLWS